MLQSKNEIEDDVGEDWERVAQEDRVWVWVWGHACATVVELVADKEEVKCTAVKIGDVNSMDRWQPLSIEAAGDRMEKAEVGCAPPLRRQACRTKNENIGRNFLVSSTRASSQIPT